MAILSINLHALCLDLIILWKKYLLPFLLLMKLLIKSVAGLDTHQQYGTSISLAEALDVHIDKYFFDYFGSPAALIGSVPKQSLNDFVEKAKLGMQRTTFTIEKHRENVERVAVVAGGGDEPEILEQAYKLGCDTYIGGTIEKMRITICTGKQ